jgi:FlaA1/EpsC-like NDP-sugar epimerase
MNTIISGVIGVTLIFFISILDDEVKVYSNYYQSYFTLLCLHVSITAISRYTITSYTNRLIHQRKIGFNTIIVGSNENAYKTFEEINQLKKGTGNLFVGFVHVDDKNGFSDELKKQLPHLGEINEIRKIVTDYQVEEIIIDDEIKNISDLIKLANKYPIIDSTKKYSINIF